MNFRQFIQVQRFFIASVAIVEEDAKVRKEIRQYLKEMSIDDVTEFSSSKEFEINYFISLVKKTKAAEVSKNLMSQFTADETKKINTFDFLTDKAFSDQKIEVEVDAKNSLITKCTNPKIFARTTAELISKNILFSSIVHPDFQSTFKKFFETSADFRPKEPLLIPFLNLAKAIWMVEVTAKVTSKNILFTLIDKTHEIGVQLGKLKEDKPKEELKTALKPLDLILFRPSAIADKNFLDWVTKASVLLKKAGLWPEENRPKFIAIRYEDDAKQKADYGHPFIDDLLCLPFDRLIFLQKVEIALALPKKKSPSYLYAQPATELVEIAKKINIERVCDLGIAISNPVPLLPGSNGHFYFRFPGQKPLLDVYAKSSVSVRHPEKLGESLIYFNFFGLGKNPNKDIKSYLSRDVAYKNTVSNDSKNFAYNPDNIFMTEEQKRKKTVVIIEPEEEVGKNIVNYFRGEIANIDIVCEDSYYLFLKKYLIPDRASENAMPAIPSDVFSEEVTVVINASTLTLEMLLTAPAENDLFLGFDATKLFSKSQEWLSLFDENAKELFLERTHLIHTIRRTEMKFDLKHADGKLRSLQLVFTPEDQSNNVRVSFNILKPKQNQLKNQITKLESLECVVIDYNLLSKDVDTFLTGLNSLAEKSHLRIPKDGVRVIVMVSETQKINFELLYKSKIFGLLFKPIEIRRLLYLASLAIETPFSIYTFENIGWKTDNITAKIASTVSLVEMSEFGATLRSKQKLKPGTLLYLFNSIFANAPDQNLCARVYASEEDEDSEEKGFYFNHVIYFGITDTFLKYVRAYIRDTYASNKNKENKA